VEELFKKHIADSGAFEEFCHDLLSAAGFVSITRRGPGADGGRDLEARWPVVDPTGTTRLTRWYCECKWYTDSLPFAEILPKLEAATAADVDYLLVMTSSRVKNTAMDQVTVWLGARGNRLNVRYWTGPDLLAMSVRHDSVFRKHFPSAVPPEWGTTPNRIRRLESLLVGFSGRNAWRIAPALQHLIMSLEHENNTLKSERLKLLAQEADLIAGMLAAQESVALGSSPALTTVHLERLVREMVTAVERRTGKFTTTTVDCTARVPRRILEQALFELLFNAALYHEGDSGPTVSLTSNGVVWRLEIANSSPEPLLPQWPIVGYQGQQGRLRNPGGAGLGCWFVERAAGLVPGCRVDWSVASGRWRAALEGSCVNESH
jgi:hypothetical protein